MAKLGERVRICYPDGIDGLTYSSLLHGRQGRVMREADYGDSGIRGKCYVQLDNKHALVNLPFWGPLHPTFTYGVWVRPEHLRPVGPDELSQEQEDAAYKVKTAKLTSGLYALRNFQDTVGRTVYLHHKGYAVWLMYATEDNTPDGKRVWQQQYDSKAHAVYAAPREGCVVRAPAMQNCA